MLKSNKLNVCKWRVFAKSVTNSAGIYVAIVMHLCIVNLVSIVFSELFNLQK